jgi:threonine synthase
MVPANRILREWAGAPFYFKNDGQNPSASFKDRGMSAALSYLNYLIKTGQKKEILAVCASTGDTSAAAALYASYLSPAIKSVVLLPQGKVTPQQLSQPLASGAKVFEIPGVFDDCMKVVEYLSEHYTVALLNSKNAWRLKGQETYSYEIAQFFDYKVPNKVLFVPIGNAGNISAVLQGFITLLDLGIIEGLPKIIGVQSHHADPVFRYYAQPETPGRRFTAVQVRPSVAQAAMIGNPVSMPRVIHLVEEYRRRGGHDRFYVIQVTEQEIMEAQLMANRNGHIACTQGGECLAGLRKVAGSPLLSRAEEAVLDSTAHALKFIEFQDMYYQDRFPEAFEIHPDPSLKNHPELIRAPGIKEFPGVGKTLSQEAHSDFVLRTAEAIANKLHI